MSSRYPILAERTRVELDIKRSRFVGTVAPVETVDDAKAFVAEIKAEFPDANHNCWAYLVGAPGRTDQVGLSDDGEPHGTAGRPMLDILVHSNVGDIAAVVTRYFGGTKLGRGGLVRAYGDSVQAALEAAPRSERVAWHVARVTIDYAGVESFKRMLPAHEATIVEEHWTERAAFDVRLPEPGLEAFRDAVRELSNGTARVE